MNTLSITDRLARNRYETDEDFCHIHVNQEVARATDAGAILTRVCPANVYREEDDGTITVEYAACLECGACLAAAPPGSLTWTYPQGGYGIQFREG